MKTVLALALSCIGFHSPVLAGLIPYADTPLRADSTSYSVKVNNTTVKVDKFGDVSYVRFAFTGTANVEVTTPAGSTIASAPISPLSYKIAGPFTGNTLTFTLTQPRTVAIPVVLNSGSVEKLLVFADGPELDAPVDPGVSGNVGGVVNFAKTYLPSGRNENDTAPVTMQLNTAISDLSSSGGGILYLPKGLYMSAQVLLKSNVNLYLHSGAMLRAVTGVGGTTDYPAQYGSDSSFIYIQDADHASITGRGIIDGNGFAIRSAYGQSGNIKLLRTNAATNLLLQDVFCRDSSRWTVHLLYSDNLLVKNIKIVNDMRAADGSFTPFSAVPLASNTDGIDPDASTYVTVDGCFVYAGDDSTSPKVTGYLGLRKVAHDIIIKNCVLMSRGAGMRVGSEVTRDINTVLFDNNDVVTGKYFVRLAHDQCPSLVTTISGIKATNNRTEYIGSGGFFNHQTSNADGSYHSNWYYGFITPSGQTANYINGVYATTRAASRSRFIGFLDSTQPDLAGVTSSPLTNINVMNMYVAGSAIDGYDSANGTLPNKTPLNTNGNTDTATATITSPGADGPPTVEVAAVDDWSTDDGPDTATFVISRMGILSGDLTVGFNLTGAISGTDFNVVSDPGVTVTSSAITIPAGQSQVNVIIRPIALNGPTPVTRTLTLAIATGSYNVSSLSSDTVEIDRVLPPVIPTVSLQIVDGSAGTDMNGNNTTNTGYATLSRTGSTANALVVNYTTTGGGATAVYGTDYNLTATATVPAGLPNAAANGTSATIPAGASSITITYKSLDPAGTYSSGHSAKVTLSANVAYTVGSPAIATCNITDAHAN